MTSYELIKFEFGDGLFLMKRMNPIRSKLPMIYDYKLDVDEENIEYPTLKIKDIYNFDFDSFRKKKRCSLEKIIFIL